MILAEPIQILGPFGPHTTQGYRLKELAVHPTLSDRAWWTITHLPTGLSFGFRWRGNVQAVEAMTKLFERRHSWKCSAEDIELTPGLAEVLIKAGGQRYRTMPRATMKQPGLNGY